MPSRNGLPPGTFYQLPPEFWQQALSLRNRLLLWRFRNYRSIRFDPTRRVDGGLVPRMNEMALPLLAVNEALGQPDDTVLALLRGQSDRVRDERSTGWEGDIVAALIRCWKRTRRRVLTVKEITDELHVDRRELERHLSAREVGRLCRDVLELRRRTLHGYPCVEIDEPRLQQLAADYNLGGLLDRERSG